MQAEVLKNGGSQLCLKHLELINANITPYGCFLLGEALSLGGSQHLTTLRLDLNAGIGDEGIIQLCRGLRTNRTLQTLTLSYCKLGPASGAALAEVISSPLSALTTLILSGNQLGSEGLSYIAKAAQVSKTLKELDLRDNEIGGGTIYPSLSAGSTSVAAGAGMPGSSSVGIVLAPKVAEGLHGTGTALMGALSESVRVASASTRAALEELGKALLDPTPPLCSVMLDLNCLAADEAIVLVPYVQGNAKVQAFTVDTTLPAELFKALFKSAAPAKKAKKAGKKKK